MKIIADLERISRPSVDLFMNDYVLSRKPVIITGALEQWKAKEWSPQLLKARIGNKEFRYRSEEGIVSARFSEMIEKIDNSTAGIPAPYLRNINLLKVFPELAGDILPSLPYLENNWRGHWAWPENWPMDVSRDLFELFISAEGVNFPRLHIDYWGMDGFVAQIYGKKEFVLYSVEDSPNLYVNPRKPLESMVDNFHDPDFARFPDLHQTTQYRVLLGPGDLLYNPGWWHTTRTLQKSITIIMAYWNQPSFDIFVSEIERNYKDCNRLKTVMMSQYFKSLGFVLRRSSRYGSAEVCSSLEQ